MSVFISNHQLADFCRKAAKLKTKYCWGTYGQNLTKELIRNKTSQYPNNYSIARQTTLQQYINNGYKACDCAGLIKWCLWTGADINKKPVYNEKTDRGTTGLWDAAKEKGILATLPYDLEGVIVYKNGHVGVYLGDGTVAECTLGTRGDGVVITKLGAVGWTHWLKIPEITYVPQEKKEGSALINHLKNILNSLGL